MGDVVGALALGESVDSTTTITSLVSPRDPKTKAPKIPPTIAANKMSKQASAAANIRVLRYGNHRFFDSP